MTLPNKALVNEKNYYLKESQKLLVQIEENAVATADAVDKFDIKTNSDKLCILTVGNNFARDLEYVLNNLQRIAIDNIKKGDNNKKLKEAVQVFSAFIFSIQLAFGNDINKVQLEIVNVLKNLNNKLKPLLDIVNENSLHTSKWEIADILDYLYMAIEKVKMRTQWEQIDYEVSQNAIEKNIFNPKLALLDILKDKEELKTDFRRFAYKSIEGVLQVLEDTDVDVEHFDDEIREVVLKVTKKVANAIFDTAKAFRNDYGMCELIMYGKLCTINILPSMYDVLDILRNPNLQDSNGKLKNFVLNAVINVLGCSIRLTRDLERILL